MFSSRFSFRSFLKYFLFLLFFLGASGAAFFFYRIYDSPGGGWAESTGSVQEVQDMGDGYYAYVLSYEVSESSAFNSSGEKVEGPITLVVYTEKKPDASRKLRLKYRVDEPTIFKVIGVVSD